MTGRRILKFSADDPYIAELNSVYKQTPRGRVCIASYYPRSDSTPRDAELVAAFEARKLNTQEKRIERELRFFRNGR